jgi:acylphosphatase
VGEPQPSDAGHQAPRRLQALVRGRVQAVGFRQFVWSRAVRLGLKGWVGNGNDGRSVEVEAEGQPEALEHLLELLRQGPYGARVDDVQASWSDELLGHTGFEVRF